MYDTVIYETKCPLCGELLNEFQTKNKACKLKKVKLDATINEMIDNCNVCRLFVEYRRDNKTNILFEYNHNYGDSKENKTGRFIYENKNNWIYLMKKMRLIRKVYKKTWKFINKK